MDPSRIKFVRYAIFTRCLRKVLPPTTNVTPSILNYEMFWLFNTLLSPFLNISHIVFINNINVRFGEGRETEEKKKNQAIFSLPIRLFPKSKGLVGACAMYGGKVSKLIGVRADTYLYFEIFYKNLYGLY